MEQECTLTAIKWTPDFVFGHKVQFLMNIIFYFLFFKSNHDTPYYYHCANYSFMYELKFLIAVLRRLLNEKSLCACSDHKSLHSI